MKPGDSGFQILAAYRFWNMIEYWYADRTLIGENRDQALKDSIQRVALAKTQQVYELGMEETIAGIHDSHALGVSRWRPPGGLCMVPVTLRFIDDHPVVTGSSMKDGVNVTSLKVGDVIVELDNTPVSELIARWSPYFAESNHAALLRDIAHLLPNGDCGETTLRIRRWR